MQTAPDKEYVCSLFSTICCCWVERWPLLDSLYFCVMTISTIGYGDLAPTTAVSKIFTMAYAILGIGLFASFVGKLVALRMAHHKKRKENRQSMM